MNILRTVGMAFALYSRIPMPRLDWRVRAGSTPSMPSLWWESRWGSVNCCGCGWRKC